MKTIWVDWLIIDPANFASRVTPTIYSKGIAPKWLLPFLLKHAEKSAVHQIKYFTAQREFKLHNINFRNDPSFAKCL